MIKLHASVSRKQPGTEPYSSRQYHAAVEIEIPDQTARDGNRLEDQIKTLWRRLEGAVEEQLREANGDSPSPRQDPGAPQRSNGEPATPKQTNFLGLLSKRVRGWGMPELQEHIRQRFGDIGIFQLTKDQASALIQELQAESQSTGGRGGRR